MGHSQSLLPSVLEILPMNNEPLHGSLVSETDPLTQQDRAESALAGRQGISRGKPSICFVALKAYTVLARHEQIQHVGGAEVQQVRMARWLADRGYPISFVTLDHGQSDGIAFDGIPIWKAYREDAGIAGLRFVHPRWSGLWHAMRRADADVYYQRGSGSQTGQVALWCHLHKRKFIFAAAAHVDCDLRLLGSMLRRRERILYRLGIGLADAVIAQTETQRTLFRRNMGLTTTLVRNCCWKSADLGQIEPAFERFSSAPRVLWVGRIASRSKRFEWLLDVAERCPEIAFDVVGPAGVDSDYVIPLVKRAARIPNVDMHGRVPYTEMAAHYQRSRLLCCTSQYEGFPNTFLEAWSLGIPVVSTFDPDDIIAKNGLGWVGRSIEEIVVCLRRALVSWAMWSEASNVARRYCLEHFAPNVCLPPMEHLIQRTVEARRT